jgi:hypothetical protein
MAAHIGQMANFAAGDMAKGRSQTLPRLCITILSI